MRTCRDHALLPITATEVVDVHSERILLVGEGPFIKLFSLTPSSLLDTFLVFETQSIHGISSFALSATHTEFRFLSAIWGGRSLSFVELKLQQDSENFCIENAIVYQEIKLDDWVLDAKFVADNGSSALRIVFLNAHNDLFCLDCPRSLNENIKVEPTLLASGPPSALYCGNIQFDSEGNILVASGTVFGGVHLWTTRSTNRVTGRGRLVAMYAGHAGSVYGIHLTRLKTQEDYNWMIITCSDDRTIKLWNFCNQLSIDYCDDSLQDLETGFAMVKLENTFEPPIASDTAHLSRIWRLAAASVLDHESMIISFGEDATAQLWQLRNDEGSSKLVLEKGRSINLHTGKHIWTGLMIEDHAQNQTLVVTGGADGLLAISNLNILQQHAVWSHNLLNDSDPISLGTLRSFCWLSCSKILAINMTGCLFLGTVEFTDHKPIVQWSLHSQFTELSERVVLHSIDSDHVIIGGSFGHVYLFSAKETKVQLLLKMDRKIAFILGCCPVKDARYCRINIAMVCLGISKLYTGVVTWNIASGDVIEDALECLDISKGFVVTTARLLQPGILALGSRKGDVAICQVNEKFVSHRLCILPRVHGKETVTSIQSLGNHEWLLTTGRDGYFRIHKAQYGNESINFTLVHAGKLPFGPDIEGAELVGEKLFIWGFRGLELILWDHSLQMEVATVECGGWHRSWSFFHGAISTFAWARANVLHITSLQPSSFLLQHGTHGREVKALAIRQRTDTLGRIFATGAEDTCIRLSRYEESKRYRTLDVIPTHTTGLQKLAWSQDGNLLFSAAGKEEFLVWQIQPIPVLEVGVTLLAKCPSVSESRILRIMDFDIIEGKTFTIVMVYSDSSIRSWHFDPEQGHFELHTKAVYSTCCITQCKILDEYLLTTSSDGHLVLWRLNDLTKLSSQRIHQSSIKCLEVQAWNNRTLVVTGGDDGALAFCLVDLSATSTWIKLIIPKAHASAINALTFIPGTTSQRTFMTASNDQRVKKWAVSVQEDNSPDIIVDRLGNYASSVADASCIQTFVDGDTHSIIVAGVGLEFWKEDGRK